MLQIKILGATPKTGKSICHGCKHASIIKGQNCEERIICSAGLWPANGSSNGVVRFRVAECGSFHPTNMPWKYEMEQIAWIVEARKRGPAGFQPEKTEMEVVIRPPNDSSENEGVIPGD